MSFTPSRNTFSLKNSARKELMLMTNINGKQVETPIIHFLDKSYVRLEAITGTDLTTVNSARVSYDKKSYEFTERDKKLVRFLAKHLHTSPFRHSFATFEIYVPLFVARQHWKHIIGSGHEEIEPNQDPFVAWNETSRRYVTEKPEFYIVQPHEWRSAPENKKQGSGEPLPINIGQGLTEELLKTYDEGLAKYERAIEMGVAPELARLFLPAYGLQIRYYWSGSVQGIAHFLNLRLGKDAQSEIQGLAKGVFDLIINHFPVSIGELVKMADEAEKEEN
jgi:thymidylate synthase (FAD)